MNNQRVREAFYIFWIRNFKPQFTVLAKEIGIEYHTLIKWKNSDRDLPDTELQKINDFIKKYSLHLVEKF